jgi:hypothetical protein
MSRWPFLLKYLSYSPVNPFDSFHTWRESTDPTLSNSLAYFTLPYLVHIVSKYSATSDHVKTR